MTPDDEQIVREAYQMTRHGAPRSPPHRCRPQAPRATRRHRPGHQLPAQRPDLLSHDPRER